MAWRSVGGVGPGPARRLFRPLTGSTAVGPGGPGLWSGACGGPWRFGEEMRLCLHQWTVGVHLLVQVQPYRLAFEPHVSADLRFHRGHLALPAARSRRPSSTLGL